MKKNRLKRFFFNRTVRLIQSVDKNHIKSSTKHLQTGVILNYFHQNEKITEYLKIISNTTFITKKIFEIKKNVILLQSIKQLTNYLTKKSFL